MIVMNAFGTTRSYRQNSRRTSNAERSLHIRKILKAKLSRKRRGNVARDVNGLCLVLEILLIEILCRASVAGDVSATKARMCQKAALVLLSCERRGRRFRDTPHVSEKAVPVPLLCERRGRRFGDESPCVRKGSPGAVVV